MAEETRIDGGAMLPSTPPPASEANPLLESAVSVGSKLDLLRAKKARGEKLTRAEAGFLGGVSRKQVAPLASAAAASSILQPVNTNPENPLFATAIEHQAPTALPFAPAVDSNLLRATASAACSSVDTVTKLAIGYVSKKAGDDHQTVEEFKTAVAMQPEIKALIVDNSEPVILALCKTFNCSPESLKGKLQGSGFVAGVVAYGVSVAQAVSKIRERHPKQPTEQK